LKSSCKSASAFLEKKITERFGARLSDVRRPIERLRPRRLRLGKIWGDGGRPLWVENFKESEELIEWMRDNLERSAVVATENPALVNLYTGLKTVSSPADPEGRKEDLERRRIKYLVHVSAYHPARLHHRRALQIFVSHRPAVSFRD
jgi:hypothetical protein